MQYYGTIGLKARRPDTSEITAILHRRHNTIPRRRLKNVTHCIFDLDGTILDSEVVYQDALRLTLKKYRRKYTKEMEERFYGSSDGHICRSLVKELLLPMSASALELEVASVVGVQLSKTPLMPGAERLLYHLYDKHIPIALATNSNDHTVKIHSTARPRLFGLFHHMVTATDPAVDRPKPFPDIYFVAASRFRDKPSPEKCLVFEDSPLGVQAAKESGMQVVMIPGPSVNREQTHQATLVIRTLLDFQPELFGLPPFDDEAKSMKTDKTTRTSAKRPRSNV